VSKLVVGFYKPKGSIFLILIKHGTVLYEVAGQTDIQGAADAKANKVLNYLN
jgi:hypothetical protein